MSCTRLAWTMASNVPKFTSFRPKPKEAKEPPKEPSKPRHERSEGTGRSAKETDRGKGQSSHREEPRLQAAGADSSKVYFRDRRGDPDIVKYGSLNRYDIPTYRRYGFGSIVGLLNDRRIDRELSTDKEFVLTPSNRHRSKRLLADKRAAQGSGRAIRFVQSAEDHEFKDLDFISLSTKSKREHGDDDQDLEDGYRGLAKNPSAGKPSDPDVEYESDTQVSYVDAAVTQRNSALVRKTQEHPDDLDAWLDLIDHQEAMMKLDRSSELSHSDKRHLADVRISIYEQGLRGVGNEEEQVKLWMGLLTEASQSWDEGRLTKKWTDVLSKFPRNVEIWIRYLNFVQQSFTSFKYESCRVTYFQCLKAIQADSGGADEAVALHVLVRLTTMMQQSGYQELALAVWQALLEFHLLRPEPAPATIRLDDDLRVFEEFWESEVARIGEAGAKGWRNSSADDGLPPPSGSSPTETLSLTDSPFQDFRRREVEAAAKLRYPGRTTDEMGEDDPFHTILFSDIEPFLRTMPRGIPATLLVDAFLGFCQLPPIPQVNSCQPRKYLHDPFLSSQFSQEAHGNDSDSFSQVLARYRASPLRGCEMTTQLLFENAFPESSTIVETVFIRRALNLLAIDPTSDEAIGEYLLAFETKYFSSEAFKTAKQLLKTRLTSLRLYNAYGLAELRRGNSAKADQVLNAALSMQKTDTAFSTSGSLELFSDWVWEALCRGDGKEALWRLVSPSGYGTKPSAARDHLPDQAALLRARTILRERNERALLSTDGPTAVMSTSLMALLAYLSGGQKPDDGLSIHNKLLDWFANRGLTKSSAAELHAQAIARFLTYHVTHAPIVKPSLLRAALEPLIANFPNNTILLSLYAANETRFSIDDRVRGIMHRKVLSTTEDRSIVGWTFAIHYEMLKSETSGSTSASIRAMFKKAEDDAGAHCPALWRQHVLFELDQARNERAKRPSKKPRRDGKKRKDESRVEEAYRRVTETFFRGMTHLPWCKDFMMLAFTHLGEEFLNQEELRRVYNVMIEKEWRLYVEVDEDTTT